MFEKHLWKSDIGGNRPGLTICVTNLGIWGKCRNSHRTPGGIPRIYERDVWGENQSRVFKCYFNWLEARTNDTKAQEVYKWNNSPDEKRKPYHQMENRLSWDTGH